jgi:hypothetical protein
VWRNNWPKTDRFHFIISLPTSSWSLRVQFAVSYDVAGLNFWDNNYAENYELSAEKTWKECMWSAVRLVQSVVNKNVQKSLHIRA